MRKNGSFFLFFCLVNSADVLILLKGQDNLTGQLKPVNLFYDNAKQIRKPFPNF